MDFGGSNHPDLVEALGTQRPTSKVPSHLAPAPSPGDFHFEKDEVSRTELGQCHPQKVPNMFNTFKHVSTKKSVTVPHLVRVSTVSTSVPPLRALLRAWAVAARPFATSSRAPPHRSRRHLHQGKRLVTASCVFFFSKTVQFFRAEKTLQS